MKLLEKMLLKASKILGIVLTNRSNGSSKIELNSFPHHSIDTYLPKLVRKPGERVNICDQLEDPKTTKKIVKRGVTELVTPEFPIEILSQIRKVIIFEDQYILKKIKLEHLF